MTLFFQFVGPAHLRAAWENEEMLEGLRNSLRQAAHGRYQVAETEASADVVVLVESVKPKSWSYPGALEREDVLRRRPASCFALNYDDDAAGILCGLYAGLSIENFDPNKHRASPYFLNRSGHADRFAIASECTPTSLLFSFRGANSHPVRQRLFERDENWRAEGAVRHIDRWFNHTPSEEVAYFEEILASEFVLCPRGFAASSHRLFEVMQLGRVPVIISDAWVAPAGPVWTNCTLRIAESRIDELPAILRARRKESTEMGRNARREWLKWFAPEARMVAAAAEIENLALARPKECDALSGLRSWQTWSNRWSRRWTLPQRVASRVRRPFVRARTGAGGAIGGA